MAMNDTDRRVLALLGELTLKEDCLYLDCSSVKTLAFEAGVSEEDLADSLKVLRLRGLADVEYACGGMLLSASLAGYALDDYLNASYAGYAEVPEKLLQWFRARPEAQWVEADQLAKEMGLPEVVVGVALIGLENEHLVALSERGEVTDVSPEVYR